MKNNTKLLEEISEAISIAGYDPYSQIYGYVTTGNDKYITRAGNARELIKSIDIAELEQYIWKVK